MCLLICGSAEAQHVAASVDREQVQVADPFTLTLTIDAVEGADVVFPEVAETLGPFQVIAHRDQFDVPIDGRRRYTRIFELEAYEGGDLAIPSVAVQMNGQTFATQPISITVQSALDTPPDPLRFRDAKDIVDIPEEALPGWIVPTTVGVSMLVAAAVLILLARKRRSGQTTPEMWAHAQLDALQREMGNAEPAITVALIGDVLRQYVDRRFKIAAPRLTTPEFLRQMATDLRLSDEQQKQIKKLLVPVDQVKFAQLDPAIALRNEAFSITRAFVDETTRQERERARRAA